MTADEIALYHIGGKVKLSMADGSMIEDYLDDKRLDNDCLWGYTFVLRNSGEIYIGMDTTFDWRPSE